MDFNMENFVKTQAPRELVPVNNVVKMQSYKVNRTPMTYPAGTIKKGL